MRECAMRSQFNGSHFCETINRSNQFIAFNCEKNKQTNDLVDEKGIFQIFIGLG